LDFKIPAKKEIYVIIVKSTVLNGKFAIACLFMKKTKLVIEYDFDFALIGITTALKGYKLAWELNRQLSIQLVKKEDILVGVKGGMERAFAAHAHETQFRFVKLIKNKPQDAESIKYYLAPEYPHFDYLLVVRDTEQSFAANILEGIRKIPSVELAAFIPLDTLKTKENFIF
jgi:hypothetical protein